MFILRKIAVFGSALLALLFVSDALFGESQSEQRFNLSFYDSATYAPQAAAEIAVTDDNYFADDVAPAERVKQVFGQFTASDGKRLKRTPTLSTEIRKSLRAGLTQDSAGA